MSKFQLIEKAYVGNNKLTLKLSVNGGSGIYISETFVVCGFITCQFRADVDVNTCAYDKNRCDGSLAVSEKYETIDKDMTVYPKISSDCNEISQTDKNIQMTGNGWHFIRKCRTSGERDRIYTEMRFTVTIYELPHTLETPSLYLNLHDDVTFPDFELCGEDGSINAHKAVLAASSPMLSTMLSGQWKETSKGKVELAGITVETLTDLKAYIYSRKMPYEDDKENIFTRLEELIKLACYLMMPDLSQTCSAQFLFFLTAQNSFKLMSLANTYKLKSLMKGVLLSIENGAIKNPTLPQDW